MGLKEKEEAFRRKESEPEPLSGAESERQHPLQSSGPHPGTRVHTCTQQCLGNISIQFKKFFLTPPCVKKKKKRASLVAQLVRNLPAMHET